MFTSFFFEINNFCNVLPRISSKTQSFISLHWLHFELINLGHLLSCGKNDMDLMFNLNLTSYWNNPLQLCKEKNKIYCLEWYTPNFLAEKIPKENPKVSVAITFWEG